MCARLRACVHCFSDVRAVARVCVLLAICACSAHTRHAGLTTVPRNSVQVWLTTSDRAQLLERQPDIAFSAADSATVTLIDVDTAQRFQTMAGFGAALTDASAALIQTSLTPPQREALLQELFGRTGIGVGFSVVRLTIGASDFSRTHYSLDDMPSGLRQRRRITRTGDGASSGTLYDPLRHSNRTNSQPSPLHMTNLILRYRLKAGVTAPDFEAFVANVDHATLRKLPRIRRFDTYRITGMLMGGEPTCDYIEVFEIDDFAGFTGEDLGGATVQSVMSAFMGMADGAEFMVAEVVDPA